MKLLSAWALLGVVLAVGVLVLYHGPHKWALVLAAANPLTPP